MSRCPRAIPWVLGIVFLTRISFNGLANKKIGASNIAWPDIVSGQQYWRGVFSGSFIAAVSRQHAILISALRLRIDMPDHRLSQHDEKTLCKVPLKRHSCEATSPLSLGRLPLHQAGFSSWTYCALWNSHTGNWTWNRLHLHTHSQRLAHMLQGRGL